MRLCGKAGRSLREQGKRFSAVTQPCCNQKSGAFEAFPRLPTSGDFSKPPDTQPVIAEAVKPWG